MRTDLVVRNGGDTRLTDQNVGATSGSDKFRDGVEASKARTKGEIAPFQNVLELPDIASLRKKIGSHAPLPVTPPASRSLRVPSARLSLIASESGPERCRKKTRMCTVLPTCSAHVWLMQLGQLVLLERRWQEKAQGPQIAQERRREKEEEAQEQGQEKKEARLQGFKTLILVLPILGAATFEKC